MPMSPSPLAFSSRTRAATSSDRTVVFCHSGTSSGCDVISTFSMPFIVAAIGSAGSCSGQYAAQSS